MNLKSSFSTDLRTLMLAFSFLAPLVIFAQVQIGELIRGNESVTVHWQGGHGPFLVETSHDLLNWSDHGEPTTTSFATLSGFAQSGFYRVMDLNAEGHYGELFGLIQTDQGEFGTLLARHRLKTRIWFYKSKGAPHAGGTYTPAEYWRKLLVNYQHYDGGVVRTWTGALESLGAIATPGDQRMTVTWTRGVDADLQTFVLTIDFPYDLNASRSTVPLPSDPDYQLTCTYATPRPELEVFEMRMIDTTEDRVLLYQLDDDSLPGWPERNYNVTRNGVQIHLHFIEGLPLHQGYPPFIWKTLLLNRWLSPSTGSGAGLPAFSTDSYFSRTLLPGHHNFFEVVLLEPAVDPALSEISRQALNAANIRHIYTFKDIDLGINGDDIRFIGYDNSIREP